MTRSYDSQLRWRWGHGVRKECARVVRRAEWGGDILPHSAHPRRWPSDTALVWSELLS